MYNSLLILSPLTHPLDSYCTKYDRDSVDDACDLEMLKDFIGGVSYSMNGIEGEDDLPSLNSVKQVWKDFTAQFRRNNDPIPPNTMLSVTNVRNSSRGPSCFYFHTHERCQLDSSS
jgi:hypothetical protein